ncbi:MAG TPA: 4Fe-4S dicluster domain-containing protein [Desulfohalobiaceae bacterium]|nr:4Fe-4S dicluster domain-containing protein [Desulfohalobiaceae bacterium]
MFDKKNNGIDSQQIKAVLKKNKAKIKKSLSLCAHCSMCAESCFLFMNHDQDPKYMPSHKIMNSLGYLYKKKGKVNEEEMESIKDIVWNRCVLCTRCYCPLGIDIPDLISLTRKICRSQGIYFTYDN